MVIIFSLITFFSTLIGGLLSIKFKDRLHLILGFTAGVILGLVCFDILPEIFELSRESDIDPIYSMVALTAGFFIFHLLEKFLAPHQEHEAIYAKHHHPIKGVFSALALAFHSFIDGIGIGLAFQVSDAVGVVVAIAVIGHTFSDGLNTGALMLMNKNSQKNTFILVLIDAFSPLLGALSTLLFKLPSNMLVIFLGFFAGSILYIGLEEILPEAHSKTNSLKPSLMTFLGLVFIFIITEILGF